MIPLHRIIILALALTMSACSADNKGAGYVQPPVKPGQVLDPDSLYAQRWPGQPALVKLKDNLILAIPAQYQEFWTFRNPLTGIDMVNRSPYPVGKLPYAKIAGFTMLMPDFSGFTPDNYLDTFDKNQVIVDFISPAPIDAMLPDAPGRYPPNMFKRISTGQYRDFDPEKYEEKYGLRCYDRLRKDSDEKVCYGKRDSKLDEYILIDVMVPPYQPHHIHPGMTASYFSPKYGGVDIAWRTHMDNWSRWKEIDAQIWKYIDAWNIAPKNSASVVGFKSSFAFGNM